MDAEEVELTIKWQGDEYTVCLAADSSVSHLKRRLAELTRVLPKRQKLMGLKDKAGKLAKDESQLADLKLKPGAAIMMLGAQEEAIDAAASSSASGGGDIVDDLQMQEELFEELEPHKDPIVLEKLERRIQKVEVKILNEPRPGKKLLVIDIDYTIFDLGSSAEQPMELARPHLHAFLTAVYPHFDIVIWSANSIKWMNVKMKALHVLDNDHFKVAFMLDYRSMLTVTTPKYGVYDCKPLELIWRKFGHVYNEANTIMLDDLRRNYVMNKQQGLVIRPFQKAFKNRATDRELVKLKYYLCEIAQLDVLSELSHRHWERYLKQRQSEASRAQMRADIDDP